jgi:uncharacterized lipoprotein
MAYRLALALLTVAALAACSSTSSPRGSSVRGASSGAIASAPPMDPKRKVAEQDCSKPVAVAEGNLRCK